MGTYNWAVRAFSEGAVFTAVDIETTGLNPRQDKIVEIGAIKFDKNGVIARFSTLIDPGIPMPPEAGRVNHITDKMLEGKPLIPEILPDFLYFTKDTVIIAHNAPFDCGFLNHKLEEHSFPDLANPTADTLIFSREVFPGKQSYSLQNLAAALGINARDAHRAEDDARICMEIFIRCLDSVRPFNGE